MEYDLKNPSISFCISDYPTDVQNSLQSCLDINGFVANEPKFRQIAADNVAELINDNARPLKLIRKLQTVIKGGKMLNVERDREMNQFGLNFALNKYEFSLDPVPGQPDLEKTGTKILAIIGISREDTSYITAYEDGDTFIYAGKMPVDACSYRPVELLKSSKLIEKVGDITYVTPRRIKVSHGSLQYSFQDAFSFADKVTKVGSRLSAITSNPKFVELTEESASIDQLTAAPIEEEAKMPSLKEIQHIVKDEAWQKLREDLSWTKGNIGSSLRRLRRYMGEAPSRKRQVRVLNLLNGVARGGIMTDDILRMQKRLRKRLGVGVPKEAAKKMRQCAWCNKNLDTGKKEEHNPMATHGICRPICPEAKKQGFTDEMMKDPKKKSALGPGELTAGFMPSLPSQPFFGQHGDGDHGDYPYPMNTLYPKISPEDADGGGQDATEAYTHVWDKIDPKRLIKLLKNYKPLSKEDVGDSQEIHKEAILNMDPDIAFRFYVPRFTITIDKPETIAGEYEATRIGNKPEGAGRLQGVTEATEATPEGKTPAEKVQEGKTPSTSIPQEGESSPIFLQHPQDVRKEKGRADRKPLTPQSDVIYQVKYVRGDAGAKNTVVGYFNVNDFLSRFVKKGEENKGLSEWLKKKLERRASAIGVLFKLTRPDVPLEQRLSWGTRLQQSYVASDWDQAYKDLASAGTPADEKEKEQRVQLLKKIVGFNEETLLEEGRYKELLALVKKYDIVPKGWNDDEKLAQEAAILGGIGLAKPSNSDYAAQVNLILDGNERYPNGGSVETKRTVLRDADIDRVLEFTLSKKFKEQPYAVQAAAVRRLEVAGKPSSETREGSEEALWAVWGNKELPSSLRRDVLNKLVLAYGYGKGGLNVSPEGRFKATKDLLSEAGDDKDVDIRAQAYRLMVDPSVDCLPWTAKGELVYSPALAKEKREQPTTDIPDWMITQLVNEKDVNAKKLGYDILEKLPKDLVVEEAPPVLNRDLKIERNGKYSFSSDILPGFRRLIIAALTDSNPRARASVRSHFGLPSETTLLAPENKDTEVVQPSAKDYIFHARVALNQNKVEDAEKQLASATHARDAENYKEEIDALKKRIVDVREHSKDREEREDRIAQLQEALMTKHPVLREIVKLAAFLDWAAKLKFQTAFRDLSVKNKEAIVSFLAKDEKWFNQWHATVLGTGPAVKDIEEDPRRKEDRRKKDDRRKEPEPEPEPEPEKPRERRRDDPFTPDEEAFGKQGSPLGKIELTSRQPPTTWPLENPQVGYGSAVPIGSQDSRGTDELMLKDVRMYFGRPEGKWRSILNKIWKNIFDDQNVQEEEELGTHKEMLHKEAAEQLPRVPPNSREEALKYLQGNEQEAYQAITFFGREGDKDGLIAAVNAFKNPGEFNNKQGLQKILQVAVEHNLPEVVEAVFNIPSTGKTSKWDIHSDAIAAFYRLKDVDALGKILFTPWYPHAVKYLVDLGLASSLKKVYRSSNDNPGLQRAIILNLGEADPEFMAEALKNPNAEVRQQALKWLGDHHKKYDVLKEHVKNEKDPKAKAELEKFLALANEGPVAEVLEHMDPEEQMSKITALTKTAADAFTKWDNYPEIRKQVLGQHGRRYGISSFNEWKQVQPEVDTEIRDAMGEYPSMEKGKEALRDLEKVAEKLPDATKRITYLKAWIEEAREKYKINKQLLERERQLSNMTEESRTELENDLSELKTKIDNAQKNLDKAMVDIKGDLDFRISQLQLLERSTTFRESLMETIKQDDSFKKEFGSGNHTWQDYQAYLKTFEKELPHKDAKLPAEGLRAIERSKEKLAWGYTEPLRKQYAQEENLAVKRLQELQPFYERLGDPEKDPRLAEFDKKIKEYKKLAKQWYKMSGTIAPYVVISDDETKRYHISPAIWLAPNKSPALPEYGTSKRLVPEQLAELRSPWTDLIEETQAEKIKLHNDLLREVAKKLPEKGKDLLVEHLQHVKKAEAILSHLQSAGVGFDGGELKYIDMGKKLEESKKRYDEDRMKLLKRLEILNKVKESNRPDDQKEYIRIKKELADFMGMYGIPPVSDTPNGQLKKQYLYDRWKSPRLRGPQDVPLTVSPEESGAYKGGGESTEEERKRVMDEINRRREEYGPAKDESGELL